MTAPSTDLFLDVEAVSGWDALPESTRAALLQLHAQQQARLPLEARGIPKDDPRESAALHPWTARIVCIALFDEAAKRGAVWHDGAGQSVIEGDWSYHPRGSEREVVRALWRYLEDRTLARLVTYNGRGYDCPLIHTRSLALRVRATRNLMPYRYSTKEHADLCDLLTFWGVSRSVSLDVVCARLGVESPKSELSGAGVERAYYEGRIADIARYCAGDVRALRECFRVWESNTGDVMQERRKF